MNTNWIRRQSRLLAVLILMVSVCGLWPSPLLRANALPQARITLLVSVPSVLRVSAGTTEVTFTEEEVRSGEQSDNRFVVEKGRAIRLVTAGNTPYALWISTPDEFFVGTNGVIPVSRLKWRTQGADWTPLSTELRLVRASVEPAQAELLIDLRLELQITDPPGHYEGEILFTLQSADV